MMWRRGLTVLGMAVLTAAPSGGTAQAPEAAPSESEDPSELARTLLAYRRASVPGSEHRKLDSLEGRWQVEIEWTTVEGANRRVRGLSENRWILGGRVLLCEATAREEGIPVEALSLYGFDVNQNRFFGLVLDNLGTDYLELIGTYDAVARSFVLSGRERDELSGAQVTYRMRLLVEGPDRHTLQLFLDVPPQGPVKILDATYTRL